MRKTTFRKALAGALTASLALSLGCLRARPVAASIASTSRTRCHVKRVAGLRHHRLVDAIKAAVAGHTAAGTESESARLAGKGAGSFWRKWSCALSLPLSSG